MSGLLSSASPWASETEKGLSSNSNSNSNTKKRTPSLSINHNKTIKKMPEDLNSSNNMEEIQEKNQFRNSRVQEIIHNMSNLTSEDAGQGLASFAPLPLFSEPKPEPPTNPSNQNSPIAYYSIEPGSGSGSKESNRNNSNLGNSYYHAYSEKSKIGNIPSYSMDRMRSANTESTNAPFIGQDKILEKLNKMIYILEEQQNEPTKHITEEFILYTFLGVFIIFIVDSFSRTGKYIR